MNTHNTNLPLAASTPKLLGAAAAMFGGAFGTRCRLRALEREHLVVESSTSLRRAQFRDDASPHVLSHQLR